MASSVIQQDTGRPPESAGVKRHFAANCLSQIPRSGSVSPVGRNRATAPCSETSTSAVARALARAASKLHGVFSSAGSASTSSIETAAGSFGSMSRGYRVIHPSPEVSRTVDRSGSSLRSASSAKAEKIPFSSEIARSME